MQQKTKDKLLLCLQEMHYIRQILNIKCADDQTSRMLGLYVAMRMDDFIHMLPTLPDTNPNKEYLESGKQEYKANMQDARNKLGSHFQTITRESTAEGENRLFDLIERNRIFSRIDYARVTDLIDDAVIAYQIATGTEDREPSIAKLTETDIERIEGLCRAKDRNNRLTVYNDYLHLGRPNSIGAIVADEGQQKAQQLNSIAMLISDVSEFYDADYAEAALKRMFKRMLVCWIVNFYDNIVTRPISPTAPQFDSGLDQLLDATFDRDITRDVQHRIASLISEIQSLKNNQTVLDNARDVRNKACAHLDRASEVMDINALIDQYDAEELREQYGLWYAIFKEILKSHNTLRPLLPIQKPEVYDAWAEKEGQKDFYGRSLDRIGNATFTGSISVEEAMAAINHPDSDKYRLAQEKLRNILFDANGSEYESLCALLCKRIETGITPYEFGTYPVLLRDAARGNPEKNQQLLFQLWDRIKKNNSNIHKFVLWPLTANAEYDESGLLKDLIKELVGSPELSTRLFGGLIAFHAEIQKTTSPFAYEQNPPLDGNFQEIASAIPVDNVQDLILWLVIASHWNCDSFFQKPNWRAYSVEIMERLKRNCETYCQSADTGIEFQERLLRLCDLHRYIELLWYLIRISRQMAAHTDEFLSVVDNNLMYGSDDQVELEYWALCHEELGLTGQAENILRRLVNENSADKCLRLSYVKFLTRHPEFSEELERQRKYLEDHFNLTEEDRKWME